LAYLVYYCKFDILVLITHVRLIDKLDYCTLMSDNIAATFMPRYNNVQYLQLVPNCGGINLFCLLLFAKAGNWTLLRAANEKTRSPPTDP
jgi:hypothetical protein